MSLDIYTDMSSANSSNEEHDGYIKNYRNKNKLKYTNILKPKKKKKMLVKICSSLVLLTNVYILISLFLKHIFILVKITN